MKKELSNYLLGRLSIYGSHNDNHHLWNNNGTWFMHLTIHDDKKMTKERIRFSLKTRSIIEARKKRDLLIEELKNDCHESLSFLYSN